MQEETYTPTESAVTEIDCPNPAYILKRGYRNNNPLNINKSGIVWEGEIRPSTDPRFSQFETMAYGYRAAFINMRTQITKRGKDTVSALIKTWAPSNENDTNGYIATVCKLTGFVAGTILNPYDEEQMKKLAAAMSIVENGTIYPVPYDAIDEGWNLYRQS